MQYLVRLLLQEHAAPMGVQDEMYELLGDPMDMPKAVHCVEHLWMDHSIARRRLPDLYLGLENHESLLRGVDGLVISKIRRDLRLGRGMGLDKGADKMYCPTLVVEIPLYPPLMEALLEAKA